MRRPALDFGGPSTSGPVERSTYARRILHGARPQVEVRPVQRGDLAPPQAGERRQQHERENGRSWVLSARPSAAIFHSARSASARVAYRSGEVRMTPLRANLSR